MKRILTLILLAFAVCLNAYPQSPSVVLKGRTVLGGVPSPSNPSDVEGTVCVSIWVNSYGEVTKAVAGAEGTNVTDEALWEAARSAAMNTRFNMSPDAPVVLQEGTITYVFRKKDEGMTRLEPPVQTDTLYIHSVRYNFTEIRKENWPFSFICQSTDRFEIGDKTFMIESVKKDVMGVIHYGFSNSRSFMELERHDDGIRITMGGYEFGCVRQKPLEESYMVYAAAVDTRPSFNGGDASEFSRWVNQRLVYPKECKDRGIQGRVTLRFTVSADGDVRDVHVERGVHPLLDAEAVRVVMKSPRWTPAMMNGVGVPITMYFPVIFFLR